MWKIVILTIMLASAVAAPALARTDHHRHANAPAASRVAPPSQPVRDRNDVPWAPF